MEIKRFSEDFTEYLQDESRQCGKAEFICFPENAEEINEAIEFCRKQGLHLTIQGSRTGITGGSVPDGGLILNLERMNKVTGMSRDDTGFYLRCQPGLKLSELRSILAEKNPDTTGWKPAEKEIWREFQSSGHWFFPPDPTETSASLGGMAACNASGARSYKYGATRNWISDIRVLPTFSNYDKISHCVINRISPDLKSAAGYYLPAQRREIDLMIGAEGTLGVLYELELKLLPQPLHYLAVMQFFKEEPAAVEFSEKLREMNLKPDAIEYFDAAAMILLRRNRQLWQELPELQDDWQQAVYYEFSGNAEEELEAAAFEAADLAEVYGSQENDCWIVDKRNEIENLKLFRHAVPEAINLKLDELKRNFPGIAKISTDLAVPDGCLSEMLHLYRETQKQGWQVIVFGHIGNNHLHTNILPRNEDEYRRGKEIALSWAKKAVELGGTVSGEHGIGKIKRNLMPVMYDPQELMLMQKIKDHYDPEGLF
ncbi:MAG: FAD-binding oxidoreductase [Candidatus Cloacimonetes bacterium]|nr:FAD-binding oxidoreductase [Candidatus Cloacimonadota bacterium]